MSRWVDRYNNHTYAEAWLELKKAVRSIELEDESIQPSVEELARLRKVVTFVDESLKSLDPELTPFQVWDNFQKQCAAAMQHINHFSQDRNINHIQNANNNIDNLLTYIRPHVIANGNAAVAIRKATTDAAKEIAEQYKKLHQDAKTTCKRIEQHENDAKENLNKTAQTLKKIADFETKTFGDDQAEGYEQKFNQFVESAESHYRDINTYYDEIFNGDAETSSINHQINSAKNEIEADRDFINEQLSKVNDRIEKLRDFYKKIFGDPENEEERKGLAAELEDRKAELSKFEIDQKERYKALNEEINSLLPGATSAGLATAYHDLKTSFDKPIENYNRLFYGSIAGLVLLAGFLAFENLGNIQGQGWDVVLKSFIYRLPLYGPILWLAFYASKRRSEYHRLQQEYAHKEALAKSYHSYKQQIEALNTDDETMLKNLMAKSIDAIAHNASDTLDKRHGDKHPLHEIAEKAADRVMQKG